MRLTFHTLIFAIFALPAFSQSFTKLTDPTLTSKSADWFAVAPVDFNNNYTIDLILANNGSDAFFLHTDSLNFSYSNTENFVNQTGSATGCFWADIDNDCDLDVIWPSRTNSGSSLYENNGDGTFTQINNSSLATDALNANSASWGDYDNDGDVDLFVARASTVGLTNYLYRNTGNFNFTKIDTGVTAQTTAISSCASWVDFDNDNDLDLYVTNRNNVNNEFYINNGNGTFTRDTSSSIVLDGANSSSTSWGDYDNDGFQDLYVANVLGEKNHLYKNNGDGTFTKILTGAMVNDQLNSHSSLWADVDNDGFLDLFVGHNSNIWAKNNLLYRNNGNGSFTKVTTGDQYSDLLQTFGVTSADINEDGFVDLITPNRYSSPITIYLNNGNANGYLHLNLLGNTSNSSAIGARVVTKSALGKQTRAIAQQTGLNHQDDMSIKMGFGTDTIIDSLTIYWPGGNTCVFTNVSPEGFYNIKEGICLMDTVTETSFTDSSSFLRGYFTHHSKGAITDYAWAFGDGDSSTLATPVHKYASAGTYAVTLTVYDAYCKHRSFTDSITICPDTARVGFIDSHQGLGVTFSDTSISEAHQFSWNFGDNTTGTGATTNHNYAQSGFYNVCLTITDSCRSKTLCRLVQVCGDTLTAGFSHSGNALTISFSDSSQNGSNIVWNFGDGTSSTASNPTHMYNSPGYYVVCQTVSDTCASNTFCDTIGVCLDTAKAGFSFTSNAVLYNFTDQSQNSNSHFWDFGDGNFSTQANPAHIFPGFGIYTVCLTITNDCYSDSSCQVINVCAAQGLADFGYQNGSIPLSVQFIDSSQNAVSRIWDFGNGNTSTNKNPLVIYSSASIYNVCLTITDSCSNKDSTCQPVDLTMFSTEEWRWLKGIKVFPNPTTGKVFIENSNKNSKEATIKVVDILGKPIKEMSFDNSNETFEIDLQDLPHGLYIINVNLNGENRSFKITKE